MRRALHVYPRPSGIYEFRRQIPEELRPAFSSRRWHIRSLGTKDLKEANKLAAAVEIEVDEQETVARNGEWPPRCDQEIELLAHDWWLIARQGLPLADPLDHGRAGGFYNEAELVEHLRRYLADNEIKIPVGTATFARIKEAAQLEHNAAIGGYAVNILRLDAATRKAEADLRNGKALAPAPTSLDERVPPVRPSRATGNGLDGLMPDAAKPLSKIEETFLTQAKGRLAAKSLNAYRKTFARFREWVGDLPVYRVTTLDVTKFYKRLTETASDKNDGKLDRGTVYRSCSNLRQFYRWAVSQHLIEEDPTRKLIVEAGGDDDGWEPYSDTDLAAIFAPTPFLPLSAHQRWFPLVGLHSGMRLSEIAQLETSDIITLNGRPHFSVSWVSKFGNEWSPRKRWTRDSPVPRVSSSATGWHLSRPWFGSAFWTDGLISRACPISRFPRSISLASISR